MSKTDPTRRYIDNPNRVEVEGQASIDDIFNVLSDTEAVEARPESLRDWALWYVRNGYAPVPVIPKSKETYVKWNHDDLPEVTEEHVISWWGKWPNASIGLLSGKRSGGVISVDCDEHHEDGRDESGLRTLHDWEKSSGELPETLSFVSGSGGIQYLYRTDADIRNSVDGTEGRRVSVDIRGEGGLFVVPPSIHKSGNRYEWQDWPWDVEPAQADENVLAFIEHVQRESKADTTKVSEDGEHVAFVLPDTIGEGSRHNTLLSYAASLRAKGYHDDTLRASLIVANDERCRPPYDRDKLEEIVAYFCDKNPGYDGKGDFMGEVPQEPCTELVPIDVYEGEYLPEPTEEHYEEPFNCLANPWLETTEKGRYKNPNVAALDWWLENDTLMDGVRLETMSQQITCDNGLLWDADATEWRTVDFIHILAEMQKRYRYQGAIVTSDANLKKAVMAYVDRHRYDRLTETLDSLPQWDGVPRCDRLFIDFLGAEDTEYTVVVTRLFLHAALARAYQPGIKWDIMLVLKSRMQGIGKSTMFRRLALSDEFFSDDIKNIGKREAQELIQGRWIVEFAEMKSTKDKDIDTVKAFITQQTDDYRVPYAELPTRKPRRCVLVGSTNEEKYLYDQTGNRRFLPLFCEGSRKLDVMRDLTNEYVQQVWAEALVEYRANPSKPLVLPRHLEAEANDHRDAATVEDFWEGMVEDWLMRHRTQAVCNLQILVECIQIGRDKIRRDDTMHMSNVMSHMDGWVRLPKSKRQTVLGYGRQQVYVYDGAI